MVSQDMSAIHLMPKQSAALIAACSTRRKTDHSDMVGAVYQCPVDLIAHGVPHRFLKSTIIRL
jgi:hypothetical protein